MHRLRKFFRLPAADRWVLFQIFIFLPLTRLGLCLFGFKRTFAAIAWLASALKRQPLIKANEADEIERLRRWIRFNKFHGLYGGNCLSRSLMLWWLLQRRGVHTEMRIGTRWLEGEFQAHAWLEYKGLPINAKSDVRQKYLAFEHQFNH